jgi:PadR family transcriptional regulator, regulatory protein PadR
MRPIALRAVLLPLLRMPRFGVELTSEIRRRAHGQLRAGAGSLYPALRSLEREGLARSWTAPPSGRRRRGRPRRYYELTARGLREVHRLRETVQAAVADPASLPILSAALMERRLRRSLALSAAARRLRASMIDAAQGS